MNVETPQNESDYIYEHDTISESTTVVSSIEESESPKVSTLETPPSFESGFGETSMFKFDEEFTQPVYSDWVKLVEPTDPNTWSNEQNLLLQEKEPVYNSCPYCCCGVFHSSASDWNNSLNYYQIPPIKTLPYQL